MPSPDNITISCHVQVLDVLVISPGVDRGKCFMIHTGLITAESTSDDLQQKVWESATSASWLDYKVSIETPKKQWVQDVLYKIC